MKSFLESYADFVLERPYLMLVLIFVVTGFFGLGAMHVQVGTLDYNDMVPEGYPEMDAILYLGNEFGTAGDSVSILVELDSGTIGSNEPKDIRAPEVIAYLDVLGEKVRTLENVASVSDLSGQLRGYNGGRLPRTRTETIELMSQDFSQIQNPFEGYVTEDYSVALMSIALEDMSADMESEFVESLKNVLEETPPPAGVSAHATGDIMLSEELMALVSTTMQTTVYLSFIGIFVVLWILFRSLKTGVVSLLGLVFGVVWTYGILGFSGMGLNAATSGSISMIMGIGIDFGIQIVNRFRQELALGDLKPALRTLFSNTIPPMGITTIAALIGFRAMNLGELTLLGELGTVLSYGILACFFAAITVIPTILVIDEKRKAPNVKKRKSR